MPLAADMPGHARPVTQLQLFWNCAERYGPDALAGTFAAQSYTKGPAERLVAGLAKLVCDGQQAGMAYDILSAFRQNPGPMETRIMQVEFEYDHDGARRATRIPFYVLAPASRIEDILPLKTAGLRNPPLQGHQVGTLQRAIEKMIQSSERPAYLAGRVEPWLGDVCEKIAGIGKPLHARLLPAGVFDREHAAFASTDEKLIAKMYAVAHSVYPAATPPPPPENVTPPCMAAVPGAP